jgi:hypothetical protein
MSMCQSDEERTISVAKGRLVGIRCFFVTACNLELLSFSLPLP